MATLPVADRWYEALIEYYALVDLDRARSLLRDMEASGQPELNLEFGRAHERAGGWVALGSGGVERGLSRMRAGVDGWGCQPCGFVTMARAHDIAGNADSSVHYWEAYQESNFGIPSIDTQLPIAYRRLGELYEARGDRERAAQYYNEFVELWKDADPELQPQVTEVRKRLSALVGERP
jgi:tetratricopeptide (TPR) repeat protein